MLTTPSAKCTDRHNGKLALRLVTGRSVHRRAMSIALLLLATCTIMTLLTVGLQNGDAFEHRRRLTTNEPDKSDEKQEDPQHLHKKIMIGDKEGVNKNLSNSDVDVVNVGDNDGDTAGMIAALWERDDILDLLTKAGADYTTANDKGKTPLIIACEQEHGFDVASHLLQMEDFKKDSGLLDARDKEGRTALHYAAQYGYADIVQLLLNHGVNPNAEDYAENADLKFPRPNIPMDLASCDECRDLLMNPTLLRAASDGKHRILNDLLTNNYKIKKVLDHEETAKWKNVIKDMRKSILYTKDSNGKILLLIALENKKRDCAQYLFNYMFNLC